MDEAFLLNCDLGLEPISYLTTLTGTVVTVPP
jgi:hypothetical protein